MHAIDASSDPASQVGCSLKQAHQNTPPQPQEHNAGSRQGAPHHIKRLELLAAPLIQTRDQHQVIGRIAQHLQELYDAATRSINYPQRNVELCLQLLAQMIQIVLTSGIRPDEDPPAKGLSPEEADPANDIEDRALR
jgi:hypothetical protein